jgi:hypothetical protein
MGYHSRAAHLRRGWASAAVGTKTPLSACDVGHMLRDKLAEHTMHAHDACTRCMHTTHAAHQHVVLRWVPHELHARIVHNDLVVCDVRVPAGLNASAVSAGWCSCALVHLERIRLSHLAACQAVRGTARFGCVGTSGHSENPLLCHLPCAADEQTVRQLHNVLQPANRRSEFRGGAGSAFNSMTSSTEARSSRLSSAKQTYSFVDGCDPLAPVVPRILECVLCHPHAGWPRDHLHEACRLCCGEMHSPGAYGDQCDTRLDPAVASETYQKARHHHLQRLHDARHNLVLESRVLALCVLTNGDQVHAVILGLVPVLRVSRKADDLHQCEAGQFGAVRQLLPSAVLCQRQRQAAVPEAHPGIDKHGRTLA